MPRKDSDGYNRYMKKYMRGYRSRERERDLALKRRLKLIDKDFYDHLFPPRKPIRKVSKKK